MLIGLHDAEREHLKNKTFPNYALMKISAFHKQRGDTVEWWNALKNPLYDRVYSSKVFTFTRENLYLPPGTIRGGTGYSVKSKLPPEVDAMFPDYSIYPECDYAIGFVTRGCPNLCPWCVVPEKEGNIVTFENGVADLVRTDSDKLLLMDNNILAAANAGDLIEAVYTVSRGYLGRKIRVDFNQGLDARLVTPDIADMLAEINWIKYIRFACDSSAAIEPLIKTVEMLTKRGVSASRIFVYFLVNDIGDAMTRVQALRKLGAITLYAQAYRDFADSGNVVSREAVYFAQKYIYSGQWRKQDWRDTPWGLKFNTP
ncbi:hypothetical protein FACS1894202_11060 [Clostridia bacterium]|nr:hypothetical protein FACS1894202_11060 [Clostridia bacterium]